MNAEVMSLLAGNARLRFLAALGQELCVAARGDYPGHAEDNERALQVLVAMNEIVLVILTQTESAWRPAAAYPDDAFVAVLAEKAEIGRCQGQLGWAMRRAIAVAEG